MAQLNAKVTVDGSAVVPLLKSVLDDADRLRSVLVACIEQINGGLPISWDAVNNKFVVDPSAVLQRLNGIDNAIGPIQATLHTAVATLQAGLPVTVDRVS